MARNYTRKLEEARKELLVLIFEIQKPVIQLKAAELKQRGRHSHS